MNFVIRKTSFAAALVAVLCLVASADAQVIRWAGDVDVARVGVLHAPDNRWVPLDPPVTVRSFGPGMRYSGLATLLGVSEADLARADVIAFEGNGGGGAGVEVGWESVTMTFTDGATTYTAHFNERVGHTSDPVVIATGSIRGPDGTYDTGWMAYNEFFGMCPSEYPNNKVVSYILIDLDAVSPTVNAASPSFSIRMENGYRADRSYGEGTPDPDSVGVFSACPK